MKLEVLTLEQCQQVRIWRNAEMEVWRTPFMLTDEMQKAFYYDIPCSRKKNHRYWAIIDEKEKYNPEKIAEKQALLLGKPLGFIGMGGITHIQFENSIGEITLIIDPEKRKDGLGEKAVDLLLDQAFNYLNLRTVFGECYKCNTESIGFWRRITEGYKGYLASLPSRKYWQGLYYPSLYFSIDKNDFNNSNKQK